MLNKIIIYLYNKYKIKIIDFYLLKTKTLK